jgi:hypothetical protein
MKLRLIFLIGILLFVCWSLYNVSEGFQSNPQLPENNNCDILKGAVNTLQKRYDKANELNEKDHLNLLKTNIDNLKNSIKNMRC